MNDTAPDSAPEPTSAEKIEGILWNLAGYNPSPFVDKMVADQAAKAAAEGLAIDVHALFTAIKAKKAGTAEPSAAQGPKPTPEQVAAAEAKLASKGLPYGAAAPEEPSKPKSARAEYERLRDSKGAPASDGSTLTAFDVDTDDQPGILDEVTGYIAKRETLFSFGGIPVEIIMGEIPGAFMDEAETTPQVSLRPVKINPHTAKRHIRSVSRWFRMHAKGHQVWKPSPDWANQMLAANNGRGLPVLAGIVTHPVIGKDGKLITGKHGYDRKTGLLIDVNPLGKPDPELGLEDPEKALAYLRDDWLGEVTFDTPADFTRALMIPATLLYARTRLRRNGRFPMFLITAPDPESGKTELAHSLVEVVIGEAIGDSPFVEKDEELKKVLLSTVMADVSARITDNVPTGWSLRSSVWDGFTTSADWSDRQLSKNDITGFPNSLLQTFTGNNVEAAGETGLRTVVTRLARKTIGKTVFKRAGLRAWTMQNRANIIHALHTVLTTTTAKPLRCRFYLWGELVAGPLMAATGQPDAMESWNETPAMPGLEDLGAMMAKMIGDTRNDGDGFTMEDLMHLAPDDFAAVTRIPISTVYAAMMKPLDSAALTDAEREREINRKTAAMSVRSSAGKQLRKHHQHRWLNLRFLVKEPTKNEDGKVRKDVKTTYRAEMSKSADGDGDGGNHPEPPE